MSQGRRNRIPRAHRQAETGAPDAEGREVEDPPEKDASGVKEHREAQEHLKVVDREATGPREVECPNSPKKGLTA